MGFFLYQELFCIITEFVRRNNNDVRSTLLFFYFNDDPRGWWVKFPPRAPFIRSTASITPPPVYLGVSVNNKGGGDVLFSTRQLDTLSLTLENVIALCRFGIAPILVVLEVYGGEGC